MQNLSETARLRLLVSLKSYRDRAVFSIIALLWFLTKEIFPFRKFHGKKLALALSKTQAVKRVSVNKASPKQYPRVELFAPKKSLGS